MSDRPSWSDKADAFFIGYVLGLILCCAAAIVQTEAM